jgi:hypothetical protein
VRKKLAATVTQYDEVAIAALERAILNYKLHPDKGGPWIESLKKRLMAYGKPLPFGLPCLTKWNIFAVII